MWTEIQDPTKFYIEIQNKTDRQTDRFLTMYGRMWTLQYTPEKKNTRGGGLVAVQAMTGYISQCHQSLPHRITSRADIKHV